jgi:hypothetical protein
MSDYPLNQDFVMDSSEALGVAQLAVNLAVAVVKHPIGMTHHPLVDQAIDILLKYGNWQEIDLPEYIKHELHEKEQT